MGQFTYLENRHKKHILECGTLDKSRLIDCELNDTIIDFVAILEHLPK